VVRLLLRLDPDELPPEARARVVRLLRAARRVAAAESEALRSDPAFLLDASRRATRRWPGRPRAGWRR
jgi:hypothetical protein